MISRYTLPQMGKIWQEEQKFSLWLRIEMLACQAWAKLGRIPSSALETIEKKANFDIKRIKEIESEVKHDVIAFLTNVAEYVGPEARYIHLGLTSSDLLDTALALQMRMAAEIILQNLDKLAKVLKEKASQHKNTLMMGRTHGIHAEPITLGLKFALWYEETKRNIERMKQAKENISYGKISGAVGTYANLDPSIEEYICKKLDLAPCPISSQIVQRDRHAQYLSTLAIIASSLNKLALQIRLLQRTETRELEEPFAHKQKGSSAMPHKRNPIICERICGLARLIRSNLQAALEDVILWEERDISHSSVERVIIPDSTILLDYILDKLIKVLQNIIIYPDNMRRNIDKGKGLFFSQRLLLKLVEKGLSREDAYRLVQKKAMQCWQEDENFQHLVEQDSEIGKYLKKEELTSIFNFQYYLRWIDYIFQKLGISINSKKTD